MSASNVLGETLRHLRTGHAVGQIREITRQVEGAIGGHAREILSAIAARFSTKRRSGPAEAAGLDERIEALMALVAGSAIQDRSRLIDLLIDLRFALGATATADAERGA
jgi:hypothetical protein